MHNLKNPFVIGGTIVVLILAGLAWNYSESIKEKNVIERERIEANERMKEAELQQARDLQEVKLQAERDKEQERLAAIGECSENAYTNYSTDWDANCELIFQENRKDYLRCFDVNRLTYGDDEWTAEMCRKLNPAPKRTDCTLPTSLKEKLDRYLKEEKDRCARL